MRSPNHVTRHNRHVSTHACNQTNDRALTTGWDFTKEEEKTQILLVRELIPTVARSDFYYSVSYREIPPAGM